MLHAEFAEVHRCEYLEGRRPWALPCDVALPCATQSELDGVDAKTLIDNRCRAVAEGAIMPSTPEALDAFRAAKVLFALLGSRGGRRSAAADHVRDPRALRGGGHR